MWTLAVQIRRIMAMVPPHRTSLSGETVRWRVTQEVCRERRVTEEKSASTSILRPIADNRKGTGHHRNASDAHTNGPHRVGPTRSCPTGGRRRVSCSGKRADSWARANAVRARTASIFCAVASGVAPRGVSSVRPYRSR